jgi:hypothetical protein
MKTQISRELDRMELVLEQIRAVGDERDALIAEQTAKEIPSRSTNRRDPWRNAAVQEWSRRPEPYLPQAG